MSSRALILCAAVLTVSCSTAQENPNYAFSSKYGQDAPSVPVMVPETAEPVALAQVQLEAQDVLPATQSDTTSPTELAYDADAMVGTPGYEALRAQEVRDALQTPPASAQLQAPVNLRPAPPRPVPSQSAQSDTVTAPSLPRTGPREITYDYAQNLTGSEVAAAQTRIETAPEPTLPSTAATATVGTYIVQPGDTVYSLSRRLCAPITDIVTPNAIGSDFAISIGQSLILPQSRC